MLKGTTILDLSWVLGGPFGGQALAQLGADVIKVESLDGDYARVIPPMTEGEDSTFFLSVNRGKKSIAINLREPAGLQVLYDLVKVSDAVIYGFSPRVPGRLGIDFESSRAVNPKIVVAQIVGFDDKGVYADAPAFDLAVQAASGVMSITGEEGGPPVRVGYQVADLAGGLYLALGTLAAINKASATGTGEHVQISLFDAQLSLLTWQAQAFLSLGSMPTAMGARHAMIAPSDAFETKDGRYIAVAPTGDEFWRRFCAAIGAQNLAFDKRFLTASDRITNVRALTTTIAPIMRTRTAQEWEDLFMSARVPAATVNRIDEALDHPISVSRRMVESVVRPSDGQPIRLLGNPFKFAGQPELSFPPALGEHTEQILIEHCGYDAEHISHLERLGVIRRKPVKSTSTPRGLENVT